MKSITLNDITDEAINQQPPSPPDMRDDGSLEVHSIFPTIQGEGPYAGHRAVFIRLAHCNLQCPGCDTEYTDGASRLPVQEIVDRILSVGYSLVVITGGEPFRQNITPLVDMLEKEDRVVQIETNGVLSPTAGFSSTAFVVCSPKTSSISKEMSERADAYKYVVRAGGVHTDGLPTHSLFHKVKETVARPPQGYSGRVYLQPMDEYDSGRNADNIQAAVDSVTENGYILCLQTHKYAGVE